MNLHNPLQKIFRLVRSKIEFSDIVAIEPMIDWLIVPELTLRKISSEQRMRDKATG